MDKLAIYGGKRVIPENTFKPWPPIGQLDKKYIIEALKSRKLTYEPYCVAFEKEFAEWNGNKFAINTNSGTAALHMCVAACGLGTGDHVLVSAYSWSSSATCILHHNCIPVFVDIDFDTMNIDTKKIEAAITPKTKAIIVVHLHGLAVNMDEVLAVAKKHKLFVIEDACQAHGALFKGKKVGTFGHCAAFSFNQNKCLCSGEGGMFVTDDEGIYKNARQLWSFGEIRTPAESRDYHAYALGWMYRSNAITAAFGRAQLTRLDDYIKVQRENASILLDLLKGTPNLILPTEPKYHSHTWYNFTLRINMKNISYDVNPARYRDAVVKAIQAEGGNVGVWQSFILPAMTVFQAHNAYGKGCPWSCPYTEPISYDVDKYPIAQLHCDTHFGMTYPIRMPHKKKEVKLMAEAIRKVFYQLDKIDPDKILRKE